MKYLLSVDKKKCRHPSVIANASSEKKINFFRGEFWYKKYCVFIKAYSFNVCKLKSNAVRVHEFAPVEHNFLWFTAKCFNFTVVCCCCARYFFFFSSRSWTVEQQLFLRWFAENDIPFMVRKWASEKKMFTTGWITKIIR